MRVSMARLVIVGAVFTTSIPSPTLGLVPSEMFACGPRCQEVLSTKFIVCPEIGWVGYSGRIWWGPLLCVGPIELSVQARPSADVQQLPLVVELRIDDLANQCISFPGIYVWETYGRSSCDPDSAWVSSIIDVPRYVGLGKEYWLQLHSFETFDAEFRELASSPYVSCVRVRTTIAVAPTTWGKVKALYR